MVYRKAVTRNKKTGLFLITIYECLKLIGLEPGTLLVTAATPPSLDPTVKVELAMLSG